MANSLSQNVLRQLFAQESSDPFLTLITLTHPTFAQPIRLVNNSVDIVSRGNTYMAFPVKIQLPVDDGETAKEFAITFDNVSLELVDEIRSVVGESQIEVRLEHILASLPNEVQIEFAELKIVTVTYNRFQISAKLGLDDFLNTEMPGEKYTPTNYRGLFG